MSLRRASLACVAAAVLPVACSDETATPGGSDGGAMPADVAAFQGCPDDLDPFAPGLRAKGDAGAIDAILVDADPVPARKFDNAWTIELVGANDEPLDGAAITGMESFMPVHNHDGRPPPTFEALPDGTFEVNVPFSMRGYWEVRLDVSAGALTDRVVFHVCAID